MRTRVKSGKRRLGIVAMVLASLFLGVSPASTWAAANAAPTLSADLNGRPLKLVDVANWYCDDFSYPAIHCFSDPTRLEARDAAILSTTALDYVTIYDYTSFAGSYMQVSQDYTVLATIGWNDRISSFKARNSLSGSFYTDWFYGGTGYYFCCNQQITSLGNFDNSFSSVHSD